MPKAREKQKDAQGKELAQGLPEYNQRPAFVVDKYPACPDSWMHGSGNSSSYFVPILPEHGMWLDFQPNNYFRKGDDLYDVAVVPSIQGINPLTGQKSDPIRLEQYREMCPKHKKEFKQDLHCDDCKYEWHPQNYLSSNNGSAFWIDGFRTEDGTIRQWYFTEDECKGIAAQVIGDERVFAIGLAFYLSKKPKPKPEPVHIHNWNYPNYVWGGGCYSLGGNLSYGSAGNMSWGSAGIVPCSTSSGDLSITNSTTTSSTNGLESVQGTPNPLHKKVKTSGKKQRTRRSGPGGQSRQSRGLERRVASRVIDTAFVAQQQANIASTQKMLEIGAGAMIRQKINRDPQELDYWNEEPEGFIYVNYCDVATAQKIIEAGTREELEEGFLSGLNTK
jgi:hypothetical protein